MRTRGRLLQVLDKAERRAVARPVAGKRRRGALVPLLVLCDVDRVSAQPAAPHLPTEPDNPELVGQDDRTVDGG